MEKEAPQGAPFLFISFKPDAVFAGQRGLTTQKSKIIF
jgi:hypothetical protein